MYLMKSRHFLYFILAAMLVLPLTISNNNGVWTYQMKIYDDNFIGIMWGLFVLAVADFIWARLLEFRKKKWSTVLVVVDSKDWNANYVDRLIGNIIKELEDYIFTKRKSTEWVSLKRDIKNNLNIGASITTREENEILQESFTKIHKHKEVSKNIHAYRMVLGASTTRQSKLYHISRG